MAIVRCLRPCAAVTCPLRLTFRSGPWEPLPSLLASF
ncbi:hypothetical protein SMD44_05054 [Streptomyces alboflavus]|uniref:Uncharacterized protein n=1 Tax=Streptomyces alboflavus TaxID=67267 RepID=A0A1Z1WGT8_9ACTN|nr:hypothetical protein SMD44_05054 [Streptomyces alboflavus]